jgi:hypothetical protein
VFEVYASVANRCRDRQNNLAPQPTPTLEEIKAIVAGKSARVDNEALVTGARLSRVVYGDFNRRGVDVCGSPREISKLKYPQPLHYWKLAIIRQ